MGFLKSFFDEKATWLKVNKILTCDPNAIAKKWIYIYYSIYYDKSLSKEEIVQIACDMTLIINNTQALFLDDGSFWYCVNPYLKINELFLTYGKIPNNFISRNISKKFKYSVEELPNEWHIIIQPIKEGSNDLDLYSLERLCFDMYILGHANDYISTRYHINMRNPGHSFKPEMIKDENGVEIPGLVHLIRLLVYKYDIKNRFEYQKEKPVLDTWLLGAGKETFYDQINRIRKNEPNSEWTKKVNENIADMKK